MLGNVTTTLLQIYCQIQQWKIWKSVNICQSYGQKHRGHFFWDTVYNLLLPFPIGKHRKRTVKFWFTARYKCGFWHYFREFSAFCNAFVNFCRRIRLTLSQKIADQLIVVGVCRIFRTFLSRILCFTYSQHKGVFVLDVHTRRCCLPVNFPWNLHSLLKNHCQFWDIFAK